MASLRGWWRRLTGRPEAEPARTPRPKRPESHPDQKPGELTLEEGTPRPKDSRTGAAGFDPYGSDAGFSKPHSWERVDHD